VTPEVKGSFAYENWRAALNGKPWEQAYEYPLFTDAHIMGNETSETYGPYQLLNTVAIARNRLSRPALVLYVAYHAKHEIPSMDQTDDERYHGGALPDEIAALVSLCIGIRLKAGGETRNFSRDGDPKGRPIAYGFNPDPILPKLRDNPILPEALETHNLEKARLLIKLPKLKPVDAVTLIRAARLYQEAIWIAESAPELSWIMLASAIETAASSWHAFKETPLERLRASRPDLEDLLTAHGDEGFVSDVAKQIAPYMGATKKFIDFILAFLPGPPAKRPYEWAQHPWEPKAMKKSLHKIYKYRSRALHGGNPFPAPMCFPPTWVAESEAPSEVPVGLAMSARGGVWVAKDTPMQLHTFEYIVRCSLLNWWKSLTTAE
jgi:hypothetical protein